MKARAKAKKAPPRALTKRAAGGDRIGIIVGRFNGFFTAKLLKAAVQTLEHAGVRRSNIEVYHVPGSFEIPVVVKRLVKKKKFGALITLGVVIKGDTRHFKHVVDAAAAGTARASVDSDIPVIHGVVAAENVGQAIARTGGKLGNKGRDAALAAIEMCGLMRRINGK